MIDLKNYEIDDIIFGYEKSKWKTEYAELMKTELNQVVRRKSCCCSRCGGTN